MRPILKDLGLDQLFDTIVISAEIGVEKPNPIIFEAACQELGVLPEEAVHVGDDRRYSCSLLPLSWLLSVVAFLIDACLSDMPCTVCSIHHIVAYQTFCLASCKIFSLPATFFASMQHLSVQKPEGLPDTLMQLISHLAFVLTSSSNLWPLLCRNDIFGARDAGCFAWLWGMDVLTFDEVSRKMLHEEEYDDPDSDAILSPIS